MANSRKKTKRRTITERKPKGVNQITFIVLYVFSIDYDFIDITRPTFAEPSLPDTNFSIDG